jgi:hypothetical protein
MGKYSVHRYLSGLDTHRWILFNALCSKADHTFRIWIFYSLELLDIILTASVNLKFHSAESSIALNRTSEKCFGLHRRPPAPTTTFPTRHSRHSCDYVDPNLFDNFASDPPIATEMETYVIEPKSDVIYIIRSSSMLPECFPSSMAELIKLAPFTADVGEHDGNVFVGRKETSVRILSQS